jgi:hypothetical protein
MGCDGPEPTKFMMRDGQPGAGFGVRAVLAWEGCMHTSGFVDWLLAAETPSIRYLALRDLLDRPADDPEVRAARADIMRTGPVPTILAGQTPAGNWSGERSYDTPKYTSTHWNLVLMVELAADPADERVQRGVEFMLADTAERALASHEPAQQDIACFWANVLRYAAYAGRSDDPRLAPIIRTLVLAAGARGWGCRYNDDLGCAWGAARALWGLAALPADRRTPEVEAVIASGTAFLFDAAHSLVDGAYPSSGPVHKHWSRLNFPLFYQVDILFVLRALADLAALDHPGALPALDWLAGLRQDDGRWRGTAAYRAYTWRVFGGSAETSRWVSLHAAAVLKQAGRLT